MPSINFNSLFSLAIVPIDEVADDWLEAGFPAPETSEFMSVIMLSPPFLSENLEIYFIIGANLETCSNSFIGLYEYFFCEKQ